MEAQYFPSGGLQYLPRDSVWRTVLEAESVTTARHKLHGQRRSIRDNLLLRGYVCRFEFAGRRPLQPDHGSDSHTLISPPLNMNHGVSQNELLDSSHGVGFLQRLAYHNYRHQPRSESFKCACQTFRETSECVMACTVSATRFSTPTLRINLATCALTVRSPMPSGVHFIEMASAER